MSTNEKQMAHPQPDPRSPATPVDDRPRLTVLIATRNRPESLARTLRSVLTSAYPHFDIVVVENASDSTDTREMLATQFAMEPRIRYLNEPRRGLARAHNAGLRIIDAPLVAITDDDVVVDSSWLERIALAFTISPSVMCVTGMIVAAELVTPAQQWVESHLGFSKGARQRVFDLGPNRPVDPLFPYNAGSLGSGANMSFRTSFLNEIGGFDPALGAGSKARGGDDLAAFYEVMVRDYSLVYEPAAIVHHFHHQTYEQLQKQMRGYGVGLGAFLTKVVAERPTSAIRLAARTIPGLRHMYSMRKTAVDSPTPSFDGRFGRLQRDERMASLAGPWAYARSRWATRNDRLDSVR